MLNLARGGFLGGGVAGGTVTGNMTMAPGTVLTIDAGSASACGLQVAGSDAGTGIAAASANDIRFYISTLSAMSFTSSNVTAIKALVANAGATINSFATIGGALRRVPAAAKTSNYVLLTSDNIVVAGSGCSTITLPAGPFTGQGFIVMNQSGGAVTLTAGSGQTIDGAGTASLADNSMTLVQLANDALTWYAGEIAAA